jgi:hypothetical protein
MEDKMKKFISVIIAGLFIFATSALAGMVEKDYHHIGDNVMLSYLIPEPEGLSWQDNFNVKKKNFKKDFAFLSFAAHSHGVEIFINGNQVHSVDDELDVDLGMEDWASNKFSIYVISIPFEFLIPGKNIVEFSARYIQSEYDDSEFGEVQIWFQ